MPLREQAADGKRTDVGGIGQLLIRNFKSDSLATLLTDAATETDEYVRHALARAIGNQA